MVHELIGIKNNRVMMDNVTTISKETIPVLFILNEIF